MIEDPCGVGSNCPPNQNIDFSIKFLINPKSVKPLENYFVLRSFTREMYAIDKGVVTSATGLEISPASLMSSRLVEPEANEEIVTGAIQTY